MSIDPDDTVDFHFNIAHNFEIEPLNLLRLIRTGGIYATTLDGYQWFTSNNNVKRWLKNLEVTQMMFYFCFERNGSESICGRNFSPNELRFSSAEEADRLANITKGKALPCLSCIRQGIDNGIFSPDKTDCDCDERYVYVCVRCLLEDKAKNEDRNGQPETQDKEDLCTCSKQQVLNHGCVCGGK